MIDYCRDPRNLIDNLRIFFSNFKHSYCRQLYSEECNEKKTTRVAIIRPYAHPPTPRVGGGDSTRLSHTYRFPKIPKENCQRFQNSPKSMLSSALKFVPFGTYSYLPGWWFIPYSEVVLLCFLCLFVLFLHFVMFLFLFDEWSSFVVDYLLTSSFSWLYFLVPKRWPVSTVWELGIP